MKKFTVTLMERVSYTVDVEAETEEDAGKVARMTWEASMHPTREFNGTGQGVEIDDVEPTAPPTKSKFTFNARVLVSLDIEAATEEEAIEILMRATLEQANLGAFADGSPVIAEIDDIEDSSGGEWSAALIDGKER